MRTGRPKKDKTLSRAISLRIAPEHEVTLRSIGGGSISDGVRTLAENCKSTQEALVSFARAYINIICRSENSFAATGCESRSQAESIAALLTRHAPEVNGRAMIYRVACGESGWIVVAERVERSA